MIITYTNSPSSQVVCNLVPNRELMWLNHSILDQTGHMIVLLSTKDGAEYQYTISNPRAIELFRYHIERFQELGDQCSPISGVMGGVFTPPPLVIISTTEIPEEVQSYLVELDEEKAYRQTQAEVDIKDASDLSLN